MKYAHFNNKSFTNSVEICLILITEFAKLIHFDEISYKKSSTYTEKYIFDTYIFGTDYTILWSVNPLFCFVYLTD